MTESKNQSSSQIWLFLGPEIGEKQIAIEEIRKKLTTGKEPKYEETVYYAGETAVPVMVSNMRNGSLFSEKRFFIIKNAEGIKKKEDIDLLSSCTANPPDDTFLILVSEETSIARGLEKNIPPVNKRIFWELPDYRKSEWVRDFFQKEGYRISKEGIEAILELVENNTAALRQECSRLLVFLEKTSVSRKTEITAEEAEKWLSHTREESPFILFSRIAAGDLSRSLESARMLLAAKETPPAIFAALASCFKKLYAYLTLKEAGITDEAEYRKIGVSSPGAKRDYSAAGRRYTTAGAETCIALTAEYDLRLRQAYSFPEQILFDRYLCKVHAIAHNKQ